MGKTYLPDIKESKMTKEMVDLINSLNNVSDSYGNIVQCTFTEDNTINDMFNFCKEHFPSIFESTYVWYGSRNGNTEENYMKYLQLQLSAAIKTYLKPVEKSVKKTVSHKSKKA